MNGDRSETALARIDAALARIEAAADRWGGKAAQTELDQLQARHERLRAAVAGSLAELDRLIEAAQG